MLSLFALAGALLLAGCTTPRPPAPVEERSTSRVPPKPPVTEAPKPVEPAPATTDTRSATYTVKPGDTLMRIALESGQAWRDIARWNGIGQVLRVLPPTAGDAVVATKPLTAPKVETKPLDANGKPPAAAASSASAPASPMGPAVPSRDNDDDVQWAWPAAGPVAANFDEARNKGLAITGKAGDPVYAAADGRVVYAGSGLRPQPDLARQGRPGRSQGPEDRRDGRLRRGTRATALRGASPGQAGGPGQAAAAALRPATLVSP
jgi:lipoprotein NlpD